MAVHSISEIFNIYDIMSTSQDDTTNTITCQLGDAIGKNVMSEEAVQWQQIGFVSRPANVLDKATDAPQCISIARTDEDLIIATRDVRGQQLHRKISEGETCLYASGPTGLGQALVYLKQDSSINLYTVSNDGTHERKGMGIFVDPMHDRISILNSQGFGIIIDSNGIMLLGKDGNSSLIGSDTRFTNLQCASLQAGSVNVENALSVTGLSTLNVLNANATTVTGVMAATTIKGTATLSSPGPLGLPSTGVAVGACNIVVLNGQVILS